MKADKEIETLPSNETLFDRFSEIRQIGSGESAAIRQTHSGVLEDMAKAVEPAGTPAGFSPVDL